MRHVGFLVLLFMLVCGPLHAAPRPAAPHGAAIDSSSTAPSPAIVKAAEDVLVMLKTASVDRAVLAPGFLAQVQPVQIEAIARQLVGRYGAPMRVARIEALSAGHANLAIDLEHAIVPVEIAVEPSAPHRIILLLFLAPQPKGDTLALVERDLWGLPGEASLAVARLGEEPPSFSISHKAKAPLAVGSAFKLLVLAELSREIRAGERHWSDVVALDRRSLPSGILQTWPKGSPLTLHSLAALMISQSDNTAADTLIAVLGREKIEALLPALGIAQPARLRPLLMTREAMLLKAGPEPGPAAKWAAADEAERRAILATLSGVPADKVDIARLAAGPVATDTIEWFASTADLVRVMDWLRRNADPRALELLAINPGVAPNLAHEFDYLGFKGGSETGVINMTLVMKGKDGAWHALSGTWNDKAAAVDEAKFLQLISRAVALVK